MMDNDSGTIEWAIDKGNGYYAVSHPYFTNNNRFKYAIWDNESQGMIIVYDDGKYWTYEFYDIDSLKELTPIWTLSTWLTKTVIDNIICKSKEYANTFMENYQNAIIARNHEISSRPKPIPPKPHFIRTKIIEKYIVRGNEVSFSRILDLPFFPYNGMYISLEGGDCVFINENNGAKVEIGWDHCKQMAYVWLSNEMDNSTASIDNIEGIMRYHEKSKWFPHDNNAKALESMKTP